MDENSLSLRLVWRSFFLYFCLQLLKSVLNWAEIGRLTHFFSLKSSWVAFAKCFGFILHLHCSTWLNLSGKESPIHLRMHPAASISNHIIIKNQLARSTGNHTCPWFITASTMSDWWCVMLWIVRYSFCSSKMYLPIILVQVQFGFFCPKILTA